MVVSYGSSNILPALPFAKRGMRLRSVAKRQSASNRDGQFAGPHGLNHVLQILRVLFGHEGDRTHLRVFGGIGQERP